MKSPNLSKAPSLETEHDTKINTEMNERIPYIDEDEFKCNSTNLQLLDINNPYMENSAEFDNPFSKDTVRNNSIDSLLLRDQGYAWVVLGAMFVSNILTTGYVKGFGILTNAVMDAYPDASGTMAGLLAGLLVGCRNILTPLAGSLANRIGLRKSIYIGVLLFSTSFIISAFCTSAAQLSITLGVMIGFSHCLIEVCQIVVVSQYFSQKLSFANGIRVASIPLGGVVYPFLLTILIQNYGLKLTFIILGGITSHIFICALLMRPIEIHMRIKAKDIVNKIINNNLFDKVMYDNLIQTKDSDVKQNLKLKEFSNQELSTKSVIQIINDKNCQSNSKYFNYQKRQLYNDIINKNSYIYQEKANNKIEFNFFRNIHYLPFIFLGAGIPMACPLALYYCILYAKSSLGLSSYEITIILAFQSIFDFNLRIFIGWLNNKNLYKQSNGFAICLCLSAIGIALLPLGRDLTSLAFIISLYSFGPASYQTFLNVILCEKFGKEHVTSTYGFVRMMHGIFAFIHSLMIGILLDMTGSYTIPFLIMAFGMFLCGLSMGMETILSIFFHSDGL